MSIINLIKAAVLSVKSHKLRVFLTMVGIIIGISSVVTILAIGEGLKAQVTQSAKDTSVNKLTVYFEAENINMDSLGKNNELEEHFNKEDCLELKKIDGIQNVEPNQGMMGNNTITANVTYFDKSATLFINEYNDKKLNVQYGRDFSEEDSKINSIVLSNKDAKKLFDPVDKAIGLGINVNGVMFEVIGVQAPADIASLDINLSSSTIEKHSMEEINSDKSFDSINIYINSDSNKDQIFENVKKQLKLSHPEVKGEYKLQDPEAITKAFEKIISGITMFIAFVTGISLFVGGVGVMNIMYVSVTERRKEIGIRRAIGAKPISILMQFLFESIIVTGMGGIIGILLGYLLSKIIGVFLPFKPILTIGSFIGATLTSVITGIVFGIIPAYNASKLDPIKAIR